MKLIPLGKRLTLRKGMQVFNFSKGLTSVSLVLIGSALLTACGKEDTDAVANNSKATSGKAVNAQGMTDEGMKAQKEFEESNKPLRAEFSAPGLADEASYLNIQSKLSAIQIYTAKRNWSENADEIAQSLSGALLVKSDLPELSQYETEFAASQDAFKKRELAEKISTLVKAQAQKIDGNIRVKMIVDADFKTYDFESRSFVSNSCIFSEKLDYTKSEMSNPNTYAKAQKPRCYLQPSTTNFLVGVVNGSKLNLKIDQEEVAKKLEDVRGSAQFEIFGYVSSVERERIGGVLRDKRYLMIDPQKVNVIDKGVILYSKTF